MLDGTSDLGGDTAGTVVAGAREVKPQSRGMRCGLRDGSLRLGWRPEAGAGGGNRARDALMRRLCMAVVWLYLIACVLALALIPATGYGLFGIEPNPFVALYAVVLGVPWSFLSAWLTGDVGVAGSMALIALGMAVNVALLRFLCRRFG